MCPTFNFNFSIDPFGNSKIKKYLGFHRNILFGKRLFFIFTILLSLSKTIMSIGAFTKKEWIPNLVLKNRTLLLNLIAPRVLSLILFKCITLKSIEIPRVTFLSTKTLYMNCLEYQKGV